MNFNFLLKGNKLTLLLPIEIWQKVQSLKRLEIVRYLCECIYNDIKALQTFGKSTFVFFFFFFVISDLFQQNEFQMKATNSSLQLNITHVVQNNSFATKILIPLLEGRCMRLEVASLPTV